MAVNKNVPTAEKKELASKSTFQTDGKTLMREYAQSSEPNIVHAGASLRNTCMVGVRSSGFFADNTIPINARERHVKSTTMGYNRD